MRQSDPIVSLALVTALLFTVASPSAYAGVEADKAAIAARLEAWSDAFNARDASQTCDLFSADLLSTVRGRPDEGRDAVCRRIAVALADRNLTMRYAPDIEEVIVSGDLAVVRIVWSVTVQDGPRSTVSKEPGIDVFRREADGRWRILRFLAFSNAPD